MPRSKSARMRELPVSSIGRSSVLVAGGTMVSRITGLIRTVVLAWAFGVTGSNAANAFGVANQLPNNIYAIISSGLLAGIVVPQIIKAAKHPDGGSRFVSKLLTLGVTVLAAATLLAVIAAPLLVMIYGSRMDAATQALTLALAYWCLPQLFFYGLYALLGEVLNARKVFGPFAWSPIINNVVSIIGFALFALTFGTFKSSLGWTPGMVALIGGTATFGIIAQALILLLFWRRAGLQVRPDFHWRGIGLRQIGKLAGWTFMMVIVGQIAGAVQVNLIGVVGRDGAGVAAMQYAWLVFMLPFSVIVLSIGTPYYTQLSEHAAARRMDAVRTDLDASTRIIGVFMVGALAAVASAILLISRVFDDDAGAFALVLGAYLVALLPLSAQFVLQRTFYAFQDTRTPFLFTLVQAVVVIVTAVAAYAVLPKEFMAAGMALGQSLANVLQLVLAVILLRRKIGPLGLTPAVRAYVRFVVAAIPAWAAGWGTYLLLGGDDGWAMDNRLIAIVGLSIVGAVSLVVYVIMLAVLRVPELHKLLGFARRFLPGR